MSGGGLAAFLSFPQNRLGRYLHWSQTVVLGFEESAVVLVDRSV
jgi:hypothetical protein